MITIRGASDDLIEIEGDIQEEFAYGADNEPEYLGFSDGTLLQIQYGAGGQGFWRIVPIRYGTAKYSKIESTDEDENYSDRVTLDGEVKWVLHGKTWTK